MGGVAGDFERAIQELGNAIGAMHLGAPLGELLGQFDEILALRVGVAPNDPRVDVGRSQYDGGTIAVSVVKSANGVDRTGQRAHLSKRRPAGDPGVAIRHGNHAGLMEREHEANFFLIGDGADKLLPARSRQTKNIIDAVVHRDLEIGLRRCFLLRASFSHLNLLLYNCVERIVQKFKVQSLIRSTELCFLITLNMEP